MRISSTINSSATTVDSSQSRSILDTNHSDSEIDKLKLSMVNYSKYRCEKFKLKQISEHAFHVHDRIKFNSKNRTYTYTSLKIDIDSMKCLLERYEVSISSQIADEFLESKQFLLSSMSLMPENNILNLTKKSKDSKESVYSLPMKLSHKQVFNIISLEHLQIFDYDKIFSLFKYNLNIIIKKEFQS